MVHPIKTCIESAYENEIPSTLVQFSTIVNILNVATTIKISTIALCLEKMVSGKSKNENHFRCILNPNPGKEVQLNMNCHVNKRRQPSDTSLLGSQF